jgi:hypothetical protein
MTWTFERGVLVVASVLIAGCVGFTVWQKSVAADLEAGLRQAEADLVEIGRKAQETQYLRGELARDGLSDDKPYAYIERQMVDSRIGKKFNISSTDGESGEGWETVHYNLAPSLSDWDFNRREIATFLLYLQGRTTRMKVTRIRLDLSTRRGAGSDDWKTVLTVSDRKPTS